LACFDEILGEHTHTIDWALFDLNSEIKCHPLIEED